MTSGGKMKVWGIIPAAGVGKRMNVDRPKQYLELAGQSVIEHTISRLLASNVFSAVVVAVSAEDHYWPQLPLMNDGRVQVVHGGAERADSVVNALSALETQAQDDEWVLVHDAARACVTVADIHLLIEELKDDPVGGILALPVHDTLKGADQGRIVETIDRSRIWRALTPQMFRYGQLKMALVEAARVGAAVTDEASALERTGKTPQIIEGRPDNIKITRPEDLPLAQFYMEQQSCE